MMLLGEKMKKKDYSFSSKVYIAQALVSMMDTMPLDDIHINELVKKPVFQECLTIAILQIKQTY